MTQSKKTQIGAVEKSVEITEALDELDGARVNELANYLGYSTSTVYDHLATLSDCGRVISKGDIYMNSLKHLYISEGVRKRYNIDEVKDSMREIARETGEIVTYVVEEENKGIFVYREDEGNDLKTARIGTKINLHSTAAGKAILAYLPESKQNEIISNGLPKETENTITTKKELLNELEEIRDQGRAFNRGERITRLHSVAVPIRDATEQAIGAIAVTGPRSRMKDRYFDQEIPDLLISKVDEIELNIAYAGNL